MRISIKGTTLIYCPYCHSLLVEHESPLTRETIDYHHEIYNVRCRKCGATGYLEEHWNHVEESED